MLELLKISAYLFLKASMNFSHKDIQEITKAKSSKKDNFIKLEIKKKDGSKANVIFEYKMYCEWLKEHKDSYNDVFKDFINEFFEKSKTEEKELSEIIDKYGSIYPDDDLPSNATNTGIGSSHFDTDKVVSQSKSRSFQYMNGPYGYGFITW